MCGQRGVRQLQSICTSESLPPLDRLLCLVEASMQLRLAATHFLPNPSEHRPVTTASECDITMTKPKDCCIRYEPNFALLALAHGPSGIS